MYSIYVHVCVYEVCINIVICMWYVDTYCNNCMYVCMCFFYKYAYDITIMWLCQCAYCTHVHTCTYTPAHLHVYVMYVCTYACSCVQVVYIQ